MTNVKTLEYGWWAVEFITHLANNESDYADLVFRSECGKQNLYPSPAEQFSKPLYSFFIDIATVFWWLNLFWHSIKN